MMNNRISHRRLPGNLAQCFPRRSEGSAAQRACGNRWARRAWTDIAIVSRRAITRLQQCWVLGVPGAGTDFEHSMVGMRKPKRQENWEGFMVRMRHWLVSLAYAVCAVPPLATESVHAATNPPPVSSTFIPVCYNSVNGSVRFVR